MHRIGRGRRAAGRQAGSSPRPRPAGWRRLLPQASLHACMPQSPHPPCLAPAPPTHPPGRWSASENWPCRSPKFSSVALLSSLQRGRATREPQQQIRRRLVIVAAPHACKRAAGPATGAHCSCSQSRAAARAGPRAPPPTSPQRTDGRRPHRSWTRRSAGSCPGAAARAASRGSHACCGRRGGQGALDAARREGECAAAAAKPPNHPCPRAHWPT